MTCHHILPSKSLIRTANWNIKISTYEAPVRALLQVRAQSSRYKSVPCALTLPPGKIRLKNVRIAPTRKLQIHRCPAAQTHIIHYIYTILAAFPSRKKIRWTALQLFFFIFVAALFRRKADSETIRLIFFQILTLQKKATWGIIYRTEGLLCASYESATKCR